MLMSSAEFHVLCVEVGLDLGCHVVIGVVLGFTTQTQYQVQSSFLLDFVVHLCTCSQTVFCDRQFSSVANYCTLFHRENGSFEVLSLHFRQRIRQFSSQVLAHHLLIRLWHNRHSQCQPYDVLRKHPKT